MSLGDPEWVKAELLPGPVLCKQLTDQDEMSPDIKHILTVGQKFDIAVTAKL